MSAAEKGTGKGKDEGAVQSAEGSSSLGLDPSSLPGAGRRSPLPQRTRAGWPAVFFGVATVLWTGATVASLKWKFLDRFSPGTPDHRLGIDFFQVPRGYQNLFHGNSIFLTELSRFGPYSTPYVNHPCVAVAVGSWTSWLGPWTGYCAFVAVSLGLLLFAATLLASALEGAAWKAFAFFVMFCSIPTYYMLWAGQMHVFLVVAVALILAGLVRLEGEREPGGQEGGAKGTAPTATGRPRLTSLSRRAFSDPRRWIEAGILLSLLSKPAVVLMLPVLLVTRETRKCVLTPVVVYAVISLLFLILPVLNPGGYNGSHWTNMVTVALSPKLSYGVSFPIERNLIRHPEIYSLPVLAHRLFDHPLPSAIRTLLGVVILGLSVAPLLQVGKSVRLRSTVAVVCLCVAVHYLTYHAICEYQYTTLLPLLPARFGSGSGKTRRSCADCWRHRLRFPCSSSCPR